MIFRILVVASLFLSNGSASAKKLNLRGEFLDETAQVSEQVKALKGNEGLVVFVVAVKPSEADKEERYLVLIEGANNEMAGKVLLHKIKYRDQSQRRADYLTVRDGKEFITLSSDSPRWGGEKQWSVQIVPPYPGNQPLWYDEKLSQKYTGIELLKRHLKQATNGDLVKLQNGQ